MKKPLTNFIWIGYIVAIVFEAINIAHNYFSYPDVDKFIAYSLLACCVFAITLLYDRSRKQDATIDYMEEKSQDMWNKVFGKVKE